MKTIKIRVPMIVTGDGKWAVSGSYELAKEGPDWAWIDEMCDHENPTINPRRFWLEAEVPLLEVDTIVAHVSQEGQHD